MTLNERIIKILEAGVVREKLLDSQMKQEN